MGKMDKDYVMDGWKDNDVLSIAYKCFYVQFRL